VSSAIETSVGIAAGLALAAALPDLPYACGLGTVPLIDGDVCASPLVPVDGMLPVGAVEPDPDLLTRWAADAELTAWWRERLDRTQALLDRTATDGD
jgi:O-succinylbenzoate synthase